MCVYETNRKKEIERSNKEEEEQKGALLCAQHIRRGAAGQRLDRGGGLTPHTHSHTRTYSFDPHTRVLTLLHILAITHRHTQTQTLIDPAAAKAGRKGRHEEATLWPLPTHK